MVCDARGIGNRDSFFVFVQISESNTLTALTSTALMAYPVLAIFLQVSLLKIKCSISDGPTVMGFLLVCFGDLKIEDEETGESDDISV